LGSTGQQVPHSDGLSLLKGEPRAGFNVTRELQGGADGSTFGVALLSRTTGGADGPVVGGSGDATSWGNWQLRHLVPTPGSVDKGFSVDEVDTALHGFVVKAYHEATRPENLVLGEEGVGPDPDLAACLRCCELHQAFAHEKNRVRCVATGVRWSNAKMGAVEVSLGAGLLGNMRALLHAKAQLRSCSRTLPEDGFLALVEHVGLEPPGDHKVLIRVGRSSEMPVTVVRAAWGFHSTPLCNLDVSGRTSGGQTATARRRRRGASDPRFVVQLAGDSGHAVGMLDSCLREAQAPGASTPDAADMDTGGAAVAIELRPAKRLRG